MRVCLKCNSQFPDTERFCELDGATLVAAEDIIAIDERRPVAPRKDASTSVLVAVALGGIAVGALLFLAYLAMTRKVETVNESTSTPSVAQQQIPSERPLPTLSEPNASPSAEPSPSPSIDPSPSPQNSATPLQLSSNPISTARASGQSGPVIIRLNSGITIEADEAWQTGEGIWYRKSSVLTLLDPKDVKAIEKVAPASPQPTASTARPSP